jgi:hypothetical protein
MARKRKQAAIVAAAFFLFFISFEIFLPSLDGNLVNF